LQKDDEHSQASSPLTEDAVSGMIVLAVS
jgi:hypothetical protein